MLARFFIELPIFAWVIAFGSQQLQRFNGLPSYNIQSQAAPRRSSGDTLKAMSELVAKLPPGVGLSWSGLSLQKAAVQRSGAILLRPVDPGRVSLPGGALGELVGSCGGAAGHSPWAWSAR